MSITGPDFWSPDQGGVMPTAVGQRCFRCGGRITKDPAWTWAGETGQIHLHPGCAADIALRIGFDLTRWQKQTGRRFHELDTWRPRV
jgi:hypothetical protein